MVNNLNSQRWTKASVLAGLWAGIEIVAGSFLHNLKIPFSGTFLTLISITLVIGFYQIWKQPGIIWRAGIITALMKSISPSAVILGPMIAITMEGVVLEVSVRLLGKNLLGYAIAGALTMLGALTHKIIHLFILYGWDIFQIYEEMFRFAVLKMGLPNAGIFYVVLSLFLIYAVLGMLAAFAGYFIGNRALEEQNSDLPGYANALEKGKWETGDAGGNYSPALLVLHIISIPALLYALSRLGPGFSLLIVLPYFMLIAFRYRIAVRRLKKWLFWMQLLVILLLALFFGKTSATGIEGKIEALSQGFSMILRALVVVLGFSGLSTELRAPVLQKLFFKTGLKQLYLAINNAFSILPAIVDGMATPQQFIRNPIRSIALSLQYVNSWHRHLTGTLPQNDPNFPESRK